MRLLLMAIAGLGLQAEPAAATPPTLPAVTQRIDAVPGFSGLIAVQRDGEVAHLSRHGRAPTPDVPVRWASVTKAVTAVLVLQEVDAGRIALDAPVSTYLPDWRANPDATVRQLLMHTSGLADPDATPDDDGDGTPDFYQGRGPDWRTICGGEPRASVDAGFHYNNCDYLVLGAVLEAVTDDTFAELVQARIVGPLGLGDVTSASAQARSEAFIGDEAEPPVDVSTYGPAGDLYGRIESMLAFDQALMDGRLISDEARTEMWRAGPETGYGGLSVWVYRLTLEPCGVTTRVVERQGAIGGVQVRNLLLPDLDMALVIWTGDGALDLGQTWSGEGLSVDLAAAAVCG